MLLVVPYYSEHVDVHFTTQSLWDATVDYYVVLVFI